ncbi:MAG: hypothetical protein RL671_1461 [Pseudomonadota bacterium]
MSLLHKLVWNRSGVAMIEFALGAPIALLAGLWGTETANLALTHMKVNQLASQIADNASRISDQSALQSHRVYEGDINDVFYGAQLQSGKLNLFRNGRVIISSLEFRPNGTTQYIHWQRCRGAKQAASSYGLENEDRPNGMGPVGEEVLTQPDEAVIFVEELFDYQPLFSDRFIPSETIRSIASFTVRDQRDLTQVYQQDPNAPDPVQSCSDFKGTISFSSSGQMT